MASDATAAGQARALLAAVGSPYIESVLDTAQLLLSELVTNVVRHTPCSSMTLSLHLAPGSIRAEVYDCDATRFPAMAPLRPTEPGGIGLRIVDQMATSWGAHETGHGKCVWFEIAAPSEN
ncbi:hypothetical protein BH10ACT3_BH10ACT3_22900 [soil metagenome]